MSDTTSPHTCTGAWFYGAFALVLVSAAPMPASTAPPTNVMLNFPVGPQTAQTQCVPVIRSLGDRMVAAWTDVQVGGVSEPKFHFGVSVDSGATFADIGAPPSPMAGPTTWFWRLDPQLVVNPTTGEFFLVGQVLRSAPLELGLGLIRGSFSGTNFVWSTPVLFRTGLGSNTANAGALCVAIAPNGSFHLLFGTSSGTIEYQRSNLPDGSTWTAPVTLSSVADQGFAAYPRLVTGPNGELYGAWVGQRGVASAPIRYRESSGFGLMWSPEITAATMRMNAALPGGVTLFLDSIRTRFSMAVNRTAGSSSFGRVALAWAESWDFSYEPFPALTQTALKNEVEPNDDTSTAATFSIGDAVLGTLSPNSDLDFWRVDLAAGDAFIVWGDSTVGIMTGLSILNTSGSEPITSGYSGSALSSFTFRAPTDGTYYLRVRLSAGPPAGGSYRIRTRVGSPQLGEARDARDVTVAHLGPAGWSSPVRFSANPSGYDDYMPTIGFGADGLDYVSWYDLSRVPELPGRSHLVVARSLAGADPVLSSAVTVTTAETNWSGLSLFIPPSMGTSNDVWSDAQRVLLAWTDGRNGNPDAFAATIPTSAAIVSCPADTAVSPGTTATPRIGILNRNTLFEEKAFVAVSGARAWPGALVVGASVAPGVTGPLIVSIPVPDTAAVGVYPLTLTVRRQSGIVLGTCNVSLTIRQVTGVGNPASRPFALDRIAPNPAHGPVQLAFTLPERAPVRVAVYGIRGERVRTLLSETRPAGSQTLTWDGLDERHRPVATGVYLVRVEALGRVAVRSVVVLR